MALNTGKNNSTNYNMFYSNPWGLDKLYSDANNESRSYNSSYTSNSQFTEKKIYNLGSERGNVSFMSSMSSPNTSSSRVSQFSEGTFGPAGIFGS
jgi:hypothetical protein